VIHDSSKGSLVLTIIVLGLLAGAALSPWLEFEESTGRNTSPDGPYGENKYVQYQRHTLGALPGHGDLEPDGDGLVQQLLLYGLAGSAFLLFVAAFGDVPVLRKIMPRNAALIMQGVACLGLIGTLLVGWFMLPRTLAAYGVTGPFTYFLVEPDGYTRTTLSFGWILGGLAALGVPMAWIQKFQAGSDDPTDVEAFRA
jgi:hypothetical protein